nr:PREDICTED: feather keratin 4-like [Phalacrocorax carbo]
MIWQCQDSTVVIQPSPVVVTLPGPILSSFPQSTAVGSSTSAALLAMALGKAE